MEELKLSEKYMLTVKEASTYFSIGEKKMRRMAENNEGGFGIFCGNRYLIIRPLMERYFKELAEKGDSQDAESTTG